MTTQSNPSPFSDIKNDSVVPNISAPSPQQPDFEMRTMKDDMVKIKSNAATEEKKSTTETTSIKPAPQPASQPASLPSPQPSTEEHGPKKIDPLESSSEKINPFAEKPLEPKANVEKIVEVPAINPSSSNKSSSATKILIAFIFVLVVAIIGLGAYYFLLTQKNNTEPAQKIETPTPEVSTPEPTEIQEPAIETPEVKLSEEKPNYLPIDINNLNASEIKDSIIKISNELKDVQMKSPYEFIIVDTNNNPITFQIFAAAAKINLSQAILASLGNDFSFYLYNDNSKIRTGLSVDIKDKAALTKELANQEKTLIKDASFLFLNETADSNNNAFATSSYSNYSIRYSNTSIADLSVDYSILDSKFTLGTSKNTERAIIDKVSTTKTQATANTSQNNCNDLASNLLSCTPYICESAIKQEIKGMQDGKCNFIQYLPNNYKMSCNLTKEMQEKVSASLKEFQSTGNASASISSNLNETEVKSEINGKANALQEALTLGQCTVNNK